MQRLGIYIHWPYCKSKCPYCDFFSRVQKNVDQSAIIKSYLADLEYYRSLNDDYRVESIFFGGGTPSLLNPQHISEIIDKITTLWHCSDRLEISLEANPNTDDGRLFSELKSVGINRLSLGVQALNDDDLKFLGRTHSLNDALASIDSVLQNFDNHSIDLIYARPTQNVQSWQTELMTACSFGLKHLSLYQLTIEENTLFAKKDIKSANEELSRELYAVSDEILSQHGYHRYEVSNYAQKGYECHHNLGYWQGYDYVGIGNGAVGRLHIAGKLYNTFYPRQQECITPQERAEELLIMGLRLPEGINKKRFTSQCNVNFSDIVNTQKLHQFCHEQLLVDTPENLCATPSGNLILNYIITQLTN